MMQVHAPQGPATLDHAGSKMDEESLDAIIHAANLMRRSTPIQCASLEVMEGAVREDIKRRLLFIPHSPSLHSSKSCLLQRGLT